MAEGKDRLADSGAVPFFQALEVGLKARRRTLQSVAEEAGIVTQSLATASWMALREKDPKPALTVFTALAVSEALESTPGMLIEGKSSKPSGQAMPELVGTDLQQIMTLASQLSSSRLKACATLAGTMMGLDFSEIVEKLGGEK